MDKRRLDLFLTESRAMQAPTSTHALAPFRQDLQRRRFIQSSGIKWKSHGDRIKTAGRVIIIHTPPTKSGRRVMFLTLEDEEGLFDLTVFENVHARYAQKILGSSILLVEGIVHRFGLRGVSIVARRFWILREFYERRGRPAPSHLSPARPSQQLTFFSRGLQDPRHNRRCQDQ